MAHFATTLRSFAVVLAVVVVGTGCRSVLRITDLDLVDAASHSPLDGPGGQAAGEDAGAQGGRLGHDDAGGKEDAGGAEPDGDAAGATCPTQNPAPEAMAPIDVHRFGTGGDDIIESVVRLDDGIVFTFTFTGGVEIGNNLFNSSLTEGTSGTPTQDFVVARLDQDYKVLWAKSYGGGGKDAAYGLAVDSDGAIYVSGEFARSAYFDGTALNSSGGADGFLMKLSPGGGRQWVKRFGGGGADAVLAVATAPGKRVVATGVFSGRETFGLGQALEAPESTGNAFLAAFSPNGSVQFAQSMPSNQSVGVGVRVGLDESILVAGSFVRTVDLGWGPKAVIDDPGNRASIFLARYGADGKTTGGFGQVLGGADEDWVGGLDVDQRGSIYLTGTFRGAASFGGEVLASRGEADAFLASYTPDGRHRYSLQAGGGLNDYGYGVNVAGDDTLLWTGSFTDRALFGTLAANGPSLQGFVASVVPCSGAIRSFYEFGGSGIDEAYDAIWDGRGKLIVTGTYAGTVTFADGLTRTAVDNDAVIIRFP